MSFRGRFTNISFATFATFATFAPEFSGSFLAVQILGMPTMPILGSGKGGKSGKRVTILTQSATIKTENLDLPLIWD